MIKKLSPLLSCAVTLLIFSVIFALNNIYPFGSLTVSWCDMNQQTIPLLCEFKDVLLGKSDFFLSLENAGGMNFFGVYFFNLSSPFTYLILFFDKADMPLAVNLMVVLKLALSSATFCIWLKHAVKNAHPIALVCFSVLYAFSGWAMMYYQILSWLDTYYLFPLLLLGLDKMSEGKSPLLYIAVLFVCMLCHFYLGWAIVLFIVLYAGLFVLTNEQKRMRFAKNFIIGSVISALLSLVVLLPCFIQYLASMRSGDVIQSLATSKFYPPSQTSLPTFFCLIALLPFLVIFIKKEKFSHIGALLCLMTVPLFIEPVAKAWQTYDYMSFPTRYGFITIALALTVALKGLTALLTGKGVNLFENKKGLKFLPIVISVVLVGLGVLFALFSKEYYGESKDILTAYSSSLWGDNQSFIALLQYYIFPLLSVVLACVLYHYKLLHKIAVYALIVILCVTEAFFSSHVYMVNPANDFASFSRAFELENVIQDDDFFRVKVNSKNYDVNLTGALGYNSLAHYTSLNRESYMIAMKQLGYSSYWMEVNSNGGTIFTDALLRNKYVINRGTKASAKYSTDSFYITENQILFPTAFIIDGEEKSEDDRDLERWQIQDNLFKRLTGKEGLHVEYEYTSLENVVDKSTEEKTVFDIGENEQGTVVYEITVSGTKALYFDYFDRYSNSLREATYGDVYSVVVKNSIGSAISRQYDFPSQSRNGVLYLGTFTDKKIKVEINLKESISAKTFGVYSVDKTLLENAVNQLISGDFVVEKDELSGKIEAKEGDLLFTSFAFDEGYKVKINGKKTNILSINGFLAIELQEGRNDIHVGFFPVGLDIGLVSFGLGLVVLALYLIFYKKIENFKKADKICVWAVLVLGAAVVLAVYIMPVFVNLLL